MNSKMATKIAAVASEAYLGGEEHTGLASSVSPLLPHEKTHSAESENWNLKGRDQECVRLNVGWKPRHPHFWPGSAANAG